MRDTRESVSIAERLSGKKQKHTSQPSSKATDPVPPTHPRIVMTVEEMGRELGISRATAYELVQRTDFPSFSIGRRVLVSRDGLLKWIEKQYTSQEQGYSEAKFDADALASLL